MHIPHIFQSWVFLFHWCCISSVKLFLLNNDYSWTPRGHTSWTRLCREYVNKQFHMYGVQHGILQGRHRFFFFLTWISYLYSSILYTTNKKSINRNSIKNIPYFKNKGNEGRVGRKGDQNWPSGSILKYSVLQIGKTQRYKCRDGSSEVWMLHSALDLDFMAA